MADNQNQPCQHTAFVVGTHVNRLLDNNGVVTHFTCDIRVECDDCGEKFVWLGQPCLHHSEPRVSVDGLKLRAPIVPQAAGQAPLDKLQRRMGGPERGQA